MLRAARIHLDPSAPSHAGAQISLKACYVKKA